jgi:hypothetical protein
MQIFNCQACGQLTLFENVRCEKCGRALGYLPDRLVMSALEPDGSLWWRALAAPERRYRPCRNHEFGVCNWMVPEGQDSGFCAACRYNRTLPDLSVPDHLQWWAKIESAKHRLVYALLKLDLPLSNRSDDPQHGLAFDFLAESSEPAGHRVMTGHDNGLITLAVDEADDARREALRTSMGEPYRTLLGHFRHEIGHYYWDILVSGGDQLHAFREIFGDERADYAAALQAHYAEGAPPDWRSSFVSAYATSHPWEDFAETWAHYLHIVDTLETARGVGVSVHLPSQNFDADAAFDPYTAGNVEELIAAWLPITFAVNNLNRSMGQPDLYPFVLSPAVIGKIGYALNLVQNTRRSRATP